MSDRLFALVMALVAGAALCMAIQTDDTVYRLTKSMIFTVTLVQAVSYYVRGLMGGRR